jgi:hypothetical protein
MVVVRRLPGPQRLLAGRRRWPKALGALLLLGLAVIVGLPSPGWAAPTVEVRNVGISRVGERTMITVILDQAVNPRVAPFTGANRSQVIIDFPQAVAAKLPESLAGDEVLVKSVRNEVSGAGVKIIVEMFPDRPYLMSREMLPLSKGLAMFRLGLRPDPDAVPAKPGPPAAYPAPPAESYGAGPGTGAGEGSLPATPSTPEPAAPSVSSLPPSGEFAELYRQVPKATGLWDFLRGQGFTVSKAQNYDTPGKASTRSFTLTSSRYPGMHVRVASVPPGSSGVPAINIVDLAMDNLEGRASDEYKKLRGWSFGQIRSKYEDIGDFFEDALKPLRVDLRKQCQNLAQRHAEFIVNFLRQAVPQKPGLGDQAMTQIRKKVSPRFEGVQYTLSENPLVILNLVDYLYIRVYYLGR